MWLRLNSILLLCCLANLAHAQRIVGYYPSWAIYGRNYLITDIPAEHLTHINYAFANISNGEIALGDPYADIDRFYPGDCWDNGCERGNFHQLRILKQQYPQLQTLISVGGWTWSENFSDAAATPAARETFANSCAQFIITHGFDGVDLDWEYPVFGGDWDVEHRPEDGANFTLLCNRIRVKLDSLETLYSRHFLLTLATSADPQHIEDLELPQLAQTVDFVNLMTYDFQGPWSTHTGFNAPLYPDSDDPYSEPVHSNYNMSAAVQNYLNAGLSRSRISVGMPFYGRGFGNVASGNNGLYQTFSGVSPFGTWENGMFDYTDLASHYVNQNGYTRYYHPISRVPWLYNPAAQVMISYDDSASIAEKGQYVISENLGGAMFWELSADRDGGLLNSLNHVFEIAQNLPAPAALTVVRVGDSLSFRWQAVTGAAQYSLWSSANPFANPLDYSLELSTTATVAMLPVAASSMKVFFVRAEQ